MVIFTNTAVTRDHYLAYETSCRLFDQKIARLLDREIEDFWDVVEDCITANLAGMVSDGYHYLGKEDRDVSNWLFAESIVRDGGNQPCMAGIFISTYLLDCIYNNVTRFITGSCKVVISGERDLLQSNRVIDRISQIDERVLLIYLNDLFGGAQIETREIFNRIMGGICESFFSEKVEENLPKDYCKIED
ncbi:hypothetical protein ACFL08_05015 [Patescibacteria group bacterium]